MRVVALITQPSVIDQILTHLRSRTAPPARTFSVRDGPTGASPRSSPAPYPRRDSGPAGPRGAPARPIPRRGQPIGPCAAGDHAVYSTDPD